jgi:hypothetical protein
MIHRNKVSLKSNCKAHLVISIREPNVARVLVDTMSLSHFGHHIYGPILAEGGNVAPNARELIHELMDNYDLSSRAIHSHLVHMHMRVPLSQVKNLVQKHRRLRSNITQDASSHCNMLLERENLDVGFYFNMRQVHFFPLLVFP